MRDIFSTKTIIASTALAATLVGGGFWASSSNERESAAPLESVLSPVSISPDLEKVNGDIINETGEPALIEEASEIPSPVKIPTVEPTPENSETAISTIKTEVKKGSPDSKPEPKLTMTFATPEPEPTVKPAAEASQTSTGSEPAEKAVEETAEETSEEPAERTAEGSVPSSGSESSSREPAPKNEVKKEAGKPSAPKKNPPSEPASKPSNPVPAKSKSSQPSSIIGVKTKLKAGEYRSDIWSGSGRGHITFKTQHDPKSAAPGMPTIVSMICDGESVYKGAYNTTNIDGVITKTIPYSGNSCRLIAKTSQSSKKWEGTNSWLYYTATDHRDGDASGSYAVTTPWKTVPVSKSKTFSYGRHDGFQGSIALKLTTCSTAGGATDSTIKNGCDGLVNKNASGRYRVEVFDDKGTIWSGDQSISYRRHHDMFTFDLNRPSQGEIRVKVTRLDGPAVLVHGDGSSLVGRR